VTSLAFLSFVVEPRRISSQTSQRMLIFRMSSVELADYSSMLAISPDKAAHAISRSHRRLASVALPAVRLRAPADQTNGSLMFFAPV
jgi:hypothetical protein